MTKNKSGGTRWYRAHMWSKTGGEENAEKGIQARPG